LVLVGSLEQLYKGPDVLIRAVAECRRNGLECELTVVGGGRHRAELETLVSQCGVREFVRFTGSLPPGQAVRAELDRSDLFVLPSRTEGLPRALLEAMARALPCVGTDVGGIPELLSPEELVPANNEVALAAKLREVLTDPERMTCLSAANLVKAREFHATVLRPRRRAFYEAVRDATRGWLRGSEAKIKDEG
jgi:glycosyltransferase involved in cell wall biosynthesis